MTGIDENIERLTAAQYRKLLAKKIKPSAEKDAIEATLQLLNLPYITELKFLEDRKFRFDFAFVRNGIKVAIEYEGINSGTSRHTSITGYSKDTEKYNLATIHGWKVLRYTMKTYKNVGSDLRKLLNL